MDREQEKRLTEMNQGRMAAMALGEFEPFLRAQKVSALTKLLVGYREGRQPNDLYHLISSLVAIDDLENEMRLLIARGRRAEAQETRN